MCQRIEDEYFSRQAIEQELDLVEIDRRHAQERAEMEAEYETEEAQHIVEIKKRVNKDHIHEVKKNYKDLLEKVTPV